MAAEAVITNEEIYREVLALKAQTEDVNGMLKDISGSLDWIEGHLYQSEVGIIGIHNTLNRTNARFDSIERRLDRIQKGRSHGNRT